MPRSLGLYGSKRRHHDRFRREANSNAIELENIENGKATTTAPKTAESIQYGTLDERSSDIIFDGPLNSQAIYTGFIEVIGMFSEHYLAHLNHKQLFKMHFFYFSE